MKVQELVEIMNNGKNKLLKPDQLQALFKKHLETKQYIGIKEKKQLVDNIVNACILYEDGIFKFDDTEKYIIFIMKTIEAYTNIELSDDIEEDYDTLCRANILESVIDTFKKEYDDVNVLLSMKCDYILSGNSVEAQLGKFLSNISDKVDDFAETLKNMVESFDIDKLPIQAEDLTKLMSFINIQK